MHYRNGEPARIGDVIVRDEASDGPVIHGIVIGGYADSDACNLTVISFVPGMSLYGGQSYAGRVTDKTGRTLSTGSVGVSFNSAVQSAHCTKLGRVDGVENITVQP